MSPDAKQELHDFCERARARRAKEREPRPEWTPADFTDLFVGIVIVIAALVCLALGL